jgi:hypothetical protein
MAEKPTEPIKRLKWFADIVENVPRATGGSFADRITDIQSARLIGKAGEVAIREIEGQQPEGSGVERGVNRGLETAGKKLVEDKLTKGDVITEKVMGALGDFLADDLRERLQGGGKGQSDAEKEVAEYHRKEEYAAVVAEIKDELVKPLAEQVQTLAAQMKETSKGGELTTERAVEMVMNAQENAKKMLEKQGYSVESINVTKEQVAKMMDEERAQQAQHEAKLKEDWEKESGAQVEIEKDRIQATENVLTGVVDKVMDMFLLPVRDKIQEAIDRGAFRAPPP